MKKYFIVAAIILLCLVITSCNKADEKKDSLNLVALNFPSYDLARTLSEGTENNITMLLPPGSESHDFEPTPKDIITISKSDLFIYTGGESDTWVDGIIENLDNRINTFSLMEEAPTVFEMTSDGMQIVEEEEEEEEDEHVWTSLSNQKILSSKLKEVLIAMDPLNREIYEENNRRFNQALDSLIKDYEDVIANGKRNVIVFADRFPLSSFVNEFNLDFFAAFPGCVHEAEASAKTVAFLINKVKAEQIPIVFHIELSDKKLALLVSEESGAAVREWNSAHNLSKEDFEKGLTYLDLAESNLAFLKEALN